MSAGAATSASSASLRRCSSKASAWLQSALLRFGVSRCSLRCRERHAELEFGDRYVLKFTDTAQKYHCHCGLLLRDTLIVVSVAGGISMNRQHRLYRNHLIVSTVIVPIACTPGVQEFLPQTSCQETKTPTPHVQEPQTLSSGIRPQNPKHLKRAKPTPTMPTPTMHLSMTTTRSDERLPGLSCAQTVAL